MIKKLILILDVIALLFLICMHEAFSVYFRHPPWDPIWEKVSSWAIIGGVPNPILDPIKTYAITYRNLLVPLYIVLALCNIVYLFVFLRNRFKKK